MIHTFKLNGVKAAIDGRDGAVILLDNLSWQMLDEIPKEQPEAMPAEMPTSLRYALAKYDSRDLAAAYQCLYTLFTTEKDAFVPQTAGSLTCVVAENGMVRNELPPLCPVTCLVVKGEVGDDAIAQLQALAEAARKQVTRLLLSAPIDTAGKLAPLFDDVLAAVPVKELSNTSLSGEMGVELLFDAEDDLSAAVTGLFAKGIAVVSASPVEDTPATAAQYEKLSRELLRHRKKGGTGIFAPFVLNYYGTEVGSHLVCGMTGEPQVAVPSMAGEFTEYYASSGTIAHLTDRLTLPETINRCVECAVCLSAE